MSRLSLPLPLSSRRPAGAAGSSAQTVSEFFRYHGLWAPGVRLFRSLGFRAKAIIISVVFAVPIVLLATSYFGAVSGAIESSLDERAGVAYNHEVLALLPLLQCQRERLRDAAVPCAGVAASGDVAAALKAQL